MERNSRNQPVRTKTTNPNFGVRISSCGVGGGLPREGVGAKKFGMSLENQDNQIIGGIPGIFAGMSQGCSKSLCPMLVPYFSSDSSVWKPSGGESENIPKLDTFGLNS